MLHQYKKEYIKGDLSSGLIVAALLIPQGIAYALIAGLPPVVGLYTATIPVLMYLIFGSSPHLSVGPVAMISILVFNGVSPYAEPGSEQFITYVVTLTFLVGVIQIMLSIIKFGILAEYVPHSVMSGFTSGCAMIIALNQVSNILGLSLHDQGNILLSVLVLVQQLNNIHILSFLIGTVSIVTLHLLNKWFPNFPNPIIMLIISTSIVYMLNLNHFGVEIIGEIPSGMPPIVFPKMTIEIIISMLPTALVIAFIGFIETVAISKVIAKKTNYSIRSNRELRALGIANFVGSFFTSMAVAGGFSRSAVNFNAGAKTKFSSISSVIFIFITLAFFTSLFFYLPKAALSVIILLAVSKLIDIKEAVEMLRGDFLNGLILVITFSATIISGPKIGLGFGIFLSLLYGIQKIKISYFRND
ncbi:MAG: SulP family inorganic anion transporter [Bacillota bacterium]